MTFSILVRDEETGRFGGAAATGSLCVGGWVLRGESRSGMSASQGTAPSTLWGEDVLEAMRGGRTAETAVRDIVSPDDGRDFRQLTALDPAGNTGGFTGASSVPFADTLCDRNIVVAGNMLEGDTVLPAMRAAFEDSTGAFGLRLLAALDGAERAGGDSRGLRSAALLIVGNDMSPLTLRIDMDDHPLEALRRLYDASQSQPYVGWLDHVPTRDLPTRSVR